MTRYEVYVSPARIKTGNYDGKGSRDYIAEFGDKPSAERFALDQVEGRGALYAIVTEKGTGNDR